MTTSSAKTPGFPALLEDSLSVVMENVFGVSGRDAILFHIGAVSIAEKPGEFHERLAAMLGSGSAVVEQEVIKSLFGRLNIQYSPSENFDLTESINEAKKRHEELA